MLERTYYFLKMCSNYVWSSFIYNALLNHLLLKFTELAKELKIVPDSLITGIL